MALTTGDKVGIGLGVAVAGFIGYEIWKSTQPGGVKDFSALTHKLEVNPSYKAAVNAAGGFSTTLTSGQDAGSHAFIYGSYPSGSNTFVPTGKAYIWGGKGSAAYVSNSQIGYTYTG